MAIFLLQFTPLSPFFTYKYHLGAWGKIQQQRQQKHSSFLFS